MRAMVRPVVSRGVFSLGDVSGIAAGLLRFLQGFLLFLQCLLLGELFLLHAGLSGLFLLVAHGGQFSSTA